jgi:hypothetical protein
MAEVCMEMGGAVTVAVICLVAAGVGVLKPVGVPREMLEVPAPTGWNVVAKR